MKSLPVRLAAALMAVLALACMAPTPSPTASQPLPTGARPSVPPVSPRPSPTASTSVSPTPPVASQDAIFRAVGAWIAENKSDQLTATVYVLLDLTNPDRWYLPGEMAELRGAQQPPWGDQLTEVSQSALEATLGAVAELEVVDIWESVVDQEAWGPLNCHPYIGGRAMLRLQRPLAIGDRFFVEANIDQGCQGLALLLGIDSTSSQFKVTEVIRDGHWIV